MPQGITLSLCRGVPDNADLRVRNLAEVQASLCPPRALQASGLLLMSAPFSSRQLRLRLASHTGQGSEAAGG